jgi:hypothetical protein
MYTAVIVEPRKHKALSFVLNNFLTNLSQDWNIIVFHGNLNKEYVSDIINNELNENKNRVSLVNLNVDNLSHEDYNKLFITNRMFYSHIPTETFLVFQTDTMICERNKHLINEFLDYDYVGAPWPHISRNVGNVGNGGLSLRKKTKMLEIMDKDPEIHIPEDDYFSCTTVTDVYKPSFEEAKRFSIEHMFSEATFGFHQPWISGNYDKIVELYPELIELKNLQ